MATFKEVHAELERESVFLSQKHDVDSFKKRTSTLTSFGFYRSSATKMYRGLSNNLQSVRAINQKYHNKTKLLLESQVERLCNKYDLYVRRSNDYLDDIPVSNIVDMENFYVYVEDLFTSIYSASGFVTRYDSCIEEIYGRYAVRTANFSACHLNERVCIAAPKSSFLDKVTLNGDRLLRDSFEGVISRNNPSPDPVELDPIVFFKVACGYLVVTAWGDEANDELVVKPSSN